MTDKKCDVAFVILQYGAYRETKKCIESIYKFAVCSFKIIVVDNMSPDDSLDMLHKNFDNKEEIVIIENKKNLGFANGNNVGFVYAKENFNPNYIIVLNNDTELLSDDLYKIICEEYAKSNFYIMGPMILTADGKYTSNPMRDKPYSKHEIEKCIKLEKFFIKFAKIHLSCVYYSIINGKNEKKAKNKDLHRYLQKQENICLHGSFLIFSRNFISEFDGFDNRTYMYGEEAILFQNMINRGYKTIYNPELRIFHAEDASTNQRFKNNNKKTVFFLENHIRSNKILLSVLEEKSVER